ncbi:hypothetical protein LTS03_011482 [Exophiala xenobiotica]|nr:hypothetical protein LTR40_002656 [Exophiala xenobiotica]KAK5285073.1 hypothetical protein LTR14_011262 [Exophiala xenobiotica]KAK5344692.1 hypothetical protein LTR61_011530 [Exophiala xenobiotica]KAK5357686.1 hypothetical protein LTS03_011482 [Exophiala xenobiotica]
MLSTVYVSCVDEAYDMLITWAESQKFTRDACSSIATVDCTNPWGWYRPWQHMRTVPDGASQKSLHYAPWNGRFYFWHKHHLLVFRRMQSPGESRSEELSISCFSRSTRILKELLEECRHHYLEIVQNKTSIFEHQGDKWKKPRVRNKRKMPTVILDETVKSLLLRDLSDFFEPTAPGWYSDRGIPYQRGYLWHGPPGTGKSSLSLSIAGEFGLDIYVVNLSSIDDKDLSTLFSELPPQCLVLLEDIDAASSKRSEVTDPTHDDQNERCSSPKKPIREMVSLSTLLNVIDGVGSPEGRVLIMTTNHPERLDDALVRPGRVDMKVEFQLTDRKMMTQLFYLVFNRLDGDHEDLWKSVDGNDPDPTKTAEYRKTVGLLAKTFVAKMPELEFSPAEVMSLLLANKQSPQQAVDNVEKWIEKTRDEKGKVKRVESWMLSE